MRTKLKEVAGVDWADGAVMNCRWRGPRLRDVLNWAGIAVPDPSTAHVAFACFATPCQDDDWYGGSIELGRGMSEEGEVILALEVSCGLLLSKKSFAYQWLYHLVLRVFPSNLRQRYDESLLCLNFTSIVGYAYSFA